MRLPRKQESPHGDRRFKSYRFRQFIRMSMLDSINVILQVEDNRHSIHLILNDQPVQGTFDPYEFAFSGNTRHALVELLTCSCGVAGCAGIFEGTRIKTRRRTVEWRDIDSGLPKKFYAFDIASYKAAQQKVLFLMRQMAEMREVANLDEDSAYDGVCAFWTIDEFERGLVRIRNWYARAR